jgi:formate dehydrogenase maturation protein FdhE
VALREERNRNPELAHIIDLHEEVMAARAKVEVALPDLAPDRAEVAALMENRVSLLERWGLDWDTDGFVALSQRICEIGARHGQESTAAFQKTRALLTSDGDRTASIVGAYLTEGRVQLAEQQAETEETLSFVLIHALHPYVHAFASVFAPLIEDERWYQRVCPVCRGEPDFGFLEEEVGGLRLLCSRCDVVWTYKRGECTFCGNSEKKTFAYYLSEDDVYRLYVCDDCHRYLKVLDGRHTSVRSLLPVQRILTIGMDISARQQGYR